MNPVAAKHSSPPAAPASEAFNRQRLLDACMKAVAENGLRDLQMNHVIARSGLSRRTAYKYFSNKTEIVNAAFLREGIRLYTGARQHVLHCTSVEDVFVYAFLYVYQQLPKNPLLREVLHNHEGLLENLDVKKTILETLEEFDLRELFAGHPALCKDIHVLSEYWVQAILSFLLLCSGEGKRLREIEAYVRKRFVPGLCLADYGLNKRATTLRLKK